MNRYIYICAFLAAFAAGGTFAYAQAGYGISGTVTDDLGPVAGATVMEQGTSNGTSTGPDGGYSLTVSSPDSPVEFSCIGYAPQVFQASQVPSTVVFKEDNQFLDEAVVIGYGTVKKDDMTGAISAIRAEELNRGAMVSTQDLLKGKVAGLVALNRLQATAKEERRDEGANAERDRKAVKPSLRRGLLRDVPPRADHGNAPR